MFELFDLLDVCTDDKDPRTVSFLGIRKVAEGSDGDGFGMGSFFADEGSVLEHVPQPVRGNALVLEFFPGDSVVNPGFIFTGQAIGPVRVVIAVGVVVQSLGTVRVIPDSVLIVVFPAQTFVATDLFVDFVSGFPGLRSNCFLLIQSRIRFIIILRSFFVIFSFFIQNNRCQNCKNSDE